MWLCTTRLSLYLCIVNYLEGLNECVEKNSHTHTSPQQFYETRRTKQLQKSNLYQFCNINDTANNCYKVESVPGIFEVILNNETHYIGDRGDYYESMHYIMWSVITAANSWLHMKLTKPPTENVH